MPEARVEHVKAAEPRLEMHMRDHPKRIFAIIDGGTTNIRVMLTEEETILGKGYAQVGAKDRVVRNEEEVLISGIRAALKASFHKCPWKGIKLQDIDYGIALGMLTSNVGLLDLEHLTTPAGVDELARGIVLKRLPQLLPCPTVFIRGVRNALPTDPGTNVSPQMDTMRSEETQTMGIIHMLPDLPLPTLITFLTSHTKYVRVNQKGQITASLTTMSGQMFAAIKRQTYLSRYIPEDGMIALDEITRDDLWEGIRAEREMGFLRAIHMPRFMDVVLSAPIPRCYSYLLGTLVGSDLRSFRYLGEVMPLDYRSLVFIGNNNRPALYMEVFKREIIRDVPAHALGREVLEEAVVQGATQIFRCAHGNGLIRRT